MAKEETAMKPSPQLVLPAGSEVRGPGRRPPLGKAIEYGLIALLVFSPLPAGSVSEWAVLVIELTAALMGAAYILLGPKPRLNPHMEPVLKRMRYPVTGFFGFLVLQVLPLPSAVVRVLSPGAYAFRKLYDPGFARLHFMTLSVAPGRTFRAGLELFAYFLLGFLVIRTVTHGSQIRRIMIVLMASGAFQALYGLAELGASHPRILFYSKVFSLESVTGTFVNRSHLSGYLEMIVPLAIGFVIARMNLFSFGAKGMRERFLLMMSRGLPGNLLALAAAVVMSLGILLSNSRSGLVVLAFSFFLFAGLSILAFGRVGYRDLWIRNVIRVTVLAVLVMAFFIGAGSTIQRFALDNLLHEDRPLFWANTVSMVRDFPLFGTGLGTFVSAYPAYETRGVPERLLVHAHNDYLEYLSELGLVGMALLLGGILYLTVRAYLAWRERRNPEAKGLALGGIVSLAGMGLHTLTDFNLHIPANTLLFTVVLALTFVSAFYRKT
jgi:O-antigen ligase